MNKHTGEASLAGDVLFDIVHDLVLARIFIYSSRERCI
jgi:hypothetical protein